MKGPVLTDKHKKLVNVRRYSSFKTEKSCESSAAANLHNLYGSSSLYLLNKHFSGVTSIILFFQHSLCHSGMEATILT